jgi:2'-5' RNA ligase
VLAERTSFAFRCQGLGAFPNTSKARVLWAGVGSGAEALAELVDAMEPALSGLGFAPEQRDFHPHVTMARLRKPQNIAGLLEGAPVEMFSKTEVDRVVLYKSSGGSPEREYARLVEWPLAKASG